MSSTFGGLNTAASGLYAAQRGMDVTGQNVSNANTVGYSRQRLQQQSIGASVVPAIWSTSTGIGGGVDSNTVQRIQDTFLQSQAQSAHAASQQLTVQNDALTKIQQIFGEPSTTGLQSQMSAMWGAWQELANNPSSEASGTAVLQATQTVVDSLHSARAALDDQWTQTQGNLTALVSDVNSTASSIAKLNQQIKVATASGLDANELSDQRDALVLHLSEQVGATSRPEEDGSVDVLVGGLTLVSGPSSVGLAVAGPADPDTTSLGSPRIVTSAGATPVSVGGTAGGDISTLTTLIPTYRGQLDQVASTLAAQVNGQQGQGVDASGGAGAPVFGPGSPTTVTAANITLALTSAAGLAPNALPAGTAAGTTVVNGQNADVISQLGSAATSPDTAYRSMITQLGVQGQSVSQSLTLQTSVTSTVDNNVQSVSGVSTDEEMTNMINYQQAYSAAARLIAVINQNLDTLINGLGVGS